jgi:hypothetical protein
MYAEEQLCPCPALRLHFLRGAEARGEIIAIASSYSAVTPNVVHTQGDSIRSYIRRIIILIVSKIRGAFVPERAEQVFSRRLGPEAHSRRPRKCHCASVQSVSPGCVGRVYPSSELTMCILLYVRRLGGTHQQPPLHNYFMRTIHASLSKRAYTYASKLLAQLSHSSYVSGTSHVEMHVQYQAQAGCGISFRRRDATPTFTPSTEACGAVEEARGPQKEKIAKASRSCGQYTSAYGSSGSRGTLFKLSSPPA